MKFQLRGETYRIKMSIDERSTSNYDRSISIWQGKDLICGYRAKSSDTKEVIVRDAKESVTKYLNQQPMIVL